MRPLAKDDETRFDARIVSEASESASASLDRAEPEGRAPAAGEGAGADAPARGTFFDRLVDAGYSPAVPASLSAFVEASSAVLVRTFETGLFGVEIVCLVDRLATPARVFGLEPRGLASAAAALSPLAGRRALGLLRRRTRITIVEVAPHEASEADRGRRRKLLWSPPAGTVVDFIHVDASSGQATWDASERHPSHVMGALTNRAASAFAVPGTLATLRTAWSETPTTVVVLAVLVALFVATGILVRSADPDPFALVALGGMQKGAIRDGEPYRLLTASLLHGGIVHILFNGFALLVSGAIVERLAGRAAMLVVFAASALGGSLLGLVVNREEVVSVGASGAIMGLLAASIVLAWTLDDKDARTALQRQAAGYLIPSLIPLAIFSGVHVDYAAHAGGAVAGAIVGGGLLLALRAGDRVRRVVLAVVRALAVVAVALYAVCATAAVRGYAPYADAIRLSRGIFVPDGTIPKDVDAAKASVETWGKDHPRDPRVRLFRALVLVDKDDLPAAERQLRDGLADGAALRRLSTDGRLEVALRGELVAILLDQGRRPEAEREAAPVCARGPNGQVPDILRDFGVCAASPR